MLHINFPHYYKFLSNLSTPEKGKLFVRNAVKAYELAPAINKAVILPDDEGQGRFCCSRYLSASVPKQVKNKTFTGISMY